MLRKKYVYILSVLVIFVFVILIIYSMYSLNKVDVNEVRPPKIKVNFENDIRLGIFKLNKEYKIRQRKNDFTSNGFLRNVIYPERRGALDFKQIWGLANSWVTNQRIFDSNSSNLGNVIRALKTAKINYADTDPRGTQLKLLLQLESSQTVVFKPQWYDREEVILGHVYAGNDRYGSEILAFYLSGILDLPYTPISVVREIHIKNEIIPHASQSLNSTIFNYKNKTCMYGKCFYCKKEKPVCESNSGKLRGAVLLHIPGKIISHRSPWQRTYKKGKQAPWEYQDNYCKQVKTQVSSNRLMDLIDTAIFDFLIQNGDRHHYETLNDKVLLLDNGKGLGNPYVHHVDILAPLYQCCNIRSSTWQRLKALSGGLLREILESITEVTEVVSSVHLKAIDERLLFVYATLENCRNNK